MFLERPHLRLDGAFAGWCLTALAGQAAGPSPVDAAGIYVSRNTYIKTGITEWRIRNPVHLVRCWLPASILPTLLSAAGQPCPVLLGSHGACLPDCRPERNPSHPVLAAGLLLPLPQVLPGRHAAVPHHARGAGHCGRIAARAWAPEQAQPACPGGALPAQGGACSCALSQLWGCSMSGCQQSPATAHQQLHAALSMLAAALAELDTTMQQSASQIHQSTWCRARRCTRPWRTRTRPARRSGAA